jgi:hypothetical protein
MAFTRNLVEAVEVSEEPEEERVNHIVVEEGVETEEAVGASTGDEAAREVAVVDVETSLLPAKEKAATEVNLPRVIEEEDLSRAVQEVEEGEEGVEVVEVEAELNVSCC